MAHGAYNYAYSRSYDAWMLLADMLCWRRRGYHFQHKMSNV